MSRQKNRYVVFLMVVLSLLTACKENNLTDREIKPVKEKYERKTHEKVQVTSGDIVPSFTLKITQDDYAVTTYGGLEETMEIDELFVEEGDRVSAGDVLIRFKEDNKEDEEKRIQYVNRIEEDELLIEHLKKLAGIDNESNYYTDMLMLENDIELTKIKVDELDKKKEKLSFVAMENGVVDFVSKDLTNGVAPQNETLLRTVKGSDSFSAVTSEDYEFSIGQIITADSALLKQDFEITDIREESGQTVLSLKPSGDGSNATSEEYSAVIEKEMMRNVVYVHNSAIKSVGDKTYVYIIDENGFLYAREVIVNCVVSDYCVIESGLEGNEWVAID